MDKNYRFFIFPKQAVQELLCLVLACKVCQLLDFLAFNLFLDVIFCSCHGLNLLQLLSIQCYNQSSSECAAASVHTSLQCSLDELVEEFCTDELQDSAYSYECVYLLAILCASEDLDTEVRVDELCSEL